MNHVYRIVFNKALGVFQVVAETATRHVKGRGKGNRSGVRRRAEGVVLLPLLLAVGWAGSPAQAAQISTQVQADTNTPGAPNPGGSLPPAQTLALKNNLPTGGSIVAGSGSISQDGTTLTVTQGSDKLIANWTSFDIGAGYTVNFLQPNRMAVALNRVLGSDASQIFGNLNANGQVFLINPHGVLFGNGAQVDVGGLVASTLDIRNDDFLAGRYQFRGNGGSVSNAGSLHAHDGGAIALLGGKVSNTGVIEARLGSVALAAGSQITLDFAGDGLLNAKVDAAVLNALVENHGVLRANGGSILMTADAGNALLQTVVNNTGLLEAQTLEHREGNIVLLGGFGGGTVNVAGTLDASAPEGGNGAAANGGFIETSGAHVKVADAATITTKAASGSNGKWLIDPTDFTVAASGGDMTGTALSNALNNGDVEIQSTSGGSGVDGDIHIKDVVSWSQNTLTLNAQRNINVFSLMNGSGTAGLFFKYGQADAGGSYNIYAPVNLASTGSFSTQSGSAGPVTHWTIITSLGTESSTTADDLQGISNGLTGHYVLGADIDASATAGWNGGQGFTPIGSSAATAFTGSFDGLGHNINNLTINRGGIDNVGLFGYANAASFANVGLTNVNILGTAGVGALLGRGDGNNSIVNAWSSGTVHSDSTATTKFGVGGLVGNMSGTVADSHSTATVDGYIAVGGLVGNMATSSGAFGELISNSWASGDVHATYGYAGGLVGRSYARITDSYATGNVSGGEAMTNSNQTLQTDLGGLVGYAHSSLYWTNQEINPIQYQNVYATGNVTGSDVVATGKGYGTGFGGLIGATDGIFTIHNAFATGNVFGYSAVGGLIGRTYNGGSGINSIASTLALYSVYTQGGTVTGHNFVGGLIGETFHSIIIDSYVASGAITGDYDSSSNYYQVGAVIGGTDCTCNGGSFGGSTGVLWDYETTGLTNPTGKKIDTSGDYLTSVGRWGASSGPDYYTDGLFWGGNTAQMMTLDPYEHAGWYTGQGGTYAILTPTTAAGQVFSDSNLISNQFFLYEGNTYPLLTAFLTQVTVSADLSGGNKIYDGHIASGTSGSYTTDIAVDLGKIFGTFSYATNSANAGTYTVSNGGLNVSGGLYSNQFGYAITYSNDTSITIGKADAYLTASSGTFTYNGNVQSLSGYSVTGMVNNEDKDVLDSVVESGGSGRNAGTYVHSLSGSDNNYNLHFIDGLLTINQANLVIGTSDVVKTYDGTTSANGSATVVGGTLYGTDSLSGGTFAYTDKNAGTGKTVAVGGVTVSDGNGGGNYAVTYANNTNSTINQANLVIGTSDVVKTYDGTTAANGTATVVGGTLYGSDSLSGGTFAYTDKNAGTGKTVTVNGVTVSDGNSGGNYAVTYANNTNSTINQANLVIGTSDVVKTYDGTTSANGTATVVGGTLYGSDSLSGGTFAYTDKNAGTGKTVTVGGVTISDGNNGGNYAVTYANNTNSTINQANLVIGTSDVVKTYDGTTSANGTATVVGGQLFGADAISGGTFAYTDKNAGTGKTVTVGGVTVSDGNGGGNYAVTYANNTNSTINQANLVIGTSDVVKTYDGTTTANGTATVVGGTLYGSDSLSGGTFAYTDKNAGTGKTVTVGGVTVSDGNNGGNYAVTYANNTNSTINQALLTITANDANKVYDGIAWSGGNGVSYSGFVNNEDYTALSGTLTYGGSSQGAVDAGTYTITASGLSSGNYAINYVDGSLIINPKLLAIIVGNLTGSVEKTYDGTTTATLDASNFLLTGWVGSDGATVTQTVGYYDNANAGVGKTVTVNLTLADYLALGSTNLANYILPTQITGNVGIINQANLVIGTSDVVKTYDGTTAANGTATVVGGTLYGTDSISGGTFAYTDKNAGTGKTVTVNGVTVNDGNGGGNYAVTYANNTTSIINQANLVIGTSDVVKTYDGTTTANGTATVVGGQLFGTDSLSGGTFAYTDKNAGTGKTVTVNDVTISDGNNGGNYAVTYANNTNSTINQANLVIGTSDVVKTYDGTTTANGTATVVGGQLYGTDSISGGTFAYTDKNAGTGKTVTVNGVTVSDGNGGGNYAVTYANNTNSTINQANLVIGTSDVVKTYDGTTSANGTATVVGGQLFGTDSLSGGTFAYTDKNAGTGKTVTVGGVTISDGNNGGNYAVTYANNTTSTINQALATVTANSSHVYYNGQYQTVEGFTATGLVNGETEDVLTGVTESGGRGKDVGRYVHGVSGSDSNYALTFVDGALDIDTSPNLLTGYGEALNSTEQQEKKKVALKTIPTPYQVVGEGIRLPDTF